MPITQVIRFHMIAPNKPAKTTVGVILVSSTMPLEIVNAILMDRNAPTRFPTAPTVTAMRGFNAPVATDVATASEASWKPQVKSKMSAVTITATTISGMCNVTSQVDRQCDHTGIAGFIARTTPDSGREE